MFATWDLATEQISENLAERETSVNVKRRIADPVLATRRRLVAGPSPPHSQIPMRPQAPRGDIARFRQSSPGDPRHLVRHSTGSGIHMRPLFQPICPRPMDEQFTEGSVAVL